MTRNTTDLFVDDVWQTSQRPLPDAIAVKARQCLLDYLGVAIAGAAMWQKQGNDLLEALGALDGPAAVIGFDRRLEPRMAAFMNGFSAHVAELDDGERLAMLHPGAPVISALIALAEREKMSGAHLLLAIVCGYEAAIRVGHAIQPGAKEKGFHATGFCGAIGAAMGTSVLLGLSRKQMKDALSAACAASSGLLNVIQDRSELKPFNVAHAAANGLLATAMARSDFSGPDDILGGKDGLAAILSDTCDLKRLRRPDPDAYAISGIYVKPYAACRHCHAAIDAILRLRLTTAIQVDAIREIDVWTYRAAIHRHDHTEIFGVSSAKMSIPYSVAVALKYGRAGIGEFQDEIVQQEVIRQLTRKVRVSEDPALTALAPRVRAARVRVVTHDQRVYDEQVQHPKGEPENPISADELNDKFYALTQFAGRSRQDAERMATLVRAVDPRLPELFALLSR